MRWTICHWTRLAPRFSSNSNKSYSEWGSIFGDSTIATAFLNRSLHHSTTFNIRCQSYRLKERRRAGLIGGREQDSGDSRALPPLSVAPARRCRLHAYRVCSPVKNLA